jgi:uncharacterized protein
MTSQITPTTASQRIELLDALRGFAIFGILMVNMPLFYKPVTSMLLGFDGSVGTLNLVSEMFIKFFFEGKFYVLFSMLFGYGFWLFINRNRPDGKSIVPTFRLRVFFLFLFGIAHIVLLWAGDILLWYALFGLWLISFRKVSDRGLIKRAIWIALIPSFFMIIVSLFTILAGINPEAKEAMSASMEGSAANMQMLADKAREVYSAGSFAEIVSVRIKEYLTVTSGAVIMFYPMVLAMFLLGVWAARKNLIKNYMEHLPFFRKALAWGLIIGLVFNIIYAWTYTQVAMSQPGPLSLLGTFSHSLGGLMFCLVYVSAIVLLAAKGRINRFLRLLAPVGRMALTNYLLHSLICTTLFLPYGFGLFSKIDAWHGILLTVIIFALQIPFSNLWLKHFNYGPFEWLWRSLTYWKLQPFWKV